MYLRPVAWADPRRVAGALRAAWRDAPLFARHPWRGELLRAVAQLPSPVVGEDDGRLMVVGSR